jgi:hypothetical protein
MVASPWLCNGISELLWVFIKYQIIFYVLNYPGEILPVLTYDLGAVDQAMNNFPFHVMGVVRLEK